MGGSSVPGRIAHIRSIAEPGARPSQAGMLRRGGRTPAARQMPASSSPTGRGSPLVSDVGPAVGLAARGRELPRSRSRRCRCTSSRSRAVPPLSSGSRPRRARSTMRATSWVSPGPQTRCGRIATTCIAADPARARSAPPPPWCARSRRARASGSAGSAPTPASAEPAYATDGDETCTKRDTPARSAASSSDRVPSTLTARNSSGAPASETFAARCTTPSAPSIARSTTADR